MNLRRIRNATFVVFAVTLIVAMEAELFAFSSVPGVCSNWNTNYDCSCDTDTFQQWQATGYCDFSEEADPEGLANEFCLDVWSACNDDCASEAFIDWLVDQNCDPFDPNDPACYDHCWEGYASGNSCGVGSVAEFTCTCAGFNWCA